MEKLSKKYYLIGEVSQICDVKSHVLRYWESEFEQLKPVKRSGRRYYQPHDIALVEKIKELVHGQGFTVAGAKAALGKKTASRVMKESNGFTPQAKESILQTIDSLIEQVQTLSKLD